MPIANRGRLTIKTCFLFLDHRVTDSVFCTGPTCGHCGCSCFLQPVKPSGVFRTSVNNAPLEPHRSNQAGSHRTRGDSVAPCVRDVASASKTGWLYTAAEAAKARGWVLRRRKVTIPDVPTGTWRCRRGGEADHRPVVTNCDRPQSIVPVASVGRCTATIEAGWSKATTLSRRPTAKACQCTRGLPSVSHRR